MNILAVDTSTQFLTVALKTDSFYEEKNSVSAGMQHSERLMSEILDLCRRAGLATSDIDCLICTRGPGSFTGLRIGMATLKGIALGSGKSVVSVSTLHTIANMVSDFDGLVIPVIDAKKQRWYIAGFECRGGAAKRVMDDTDGTEADLAKLISNYEKVLVAGPDAEKFAEVLRLSFKDHDFTVVGDCPKSLSESLIELGVAQFNEKGADDIGQGPVYIRKSDAEVALEEREKSR